MDIDGVLDAVPAGLCVVRNLRDGAGIAIGDVVKLVEVLYFDDIGIHFDCVDEGLVAYSLAVSRLAVAYIG